MKKANFCQLWLTCKDKAEAGKIANTLLVKHLVACVRRIPITSSYWWKGSSSGASAKEDKIEHSDEVLLMMESKMEHFGKVKAEVSKLHSYETFVLEASPVAKISKPASRWLSGELKDGR